ncbi:MAG: bacteriophage abortive infection AbiH family protein [Muribaculaceae bacterium]|nr:bacteriophage abortive infection AbiH family protein [Muribaculaceae bacterium]
MNKIDTLVIIGNGFDIWQGLDTSYKGFQKYYLEHRDDILRKLWIKKKRIKNENGERQYISDVELVYSDPFNPEDLDNIFWYTFEESLAKIDSFKLNLFYGKEPKAIKAMSKSINNAKRILKEAFSQWIRTINTETAKNDFEFGDNCIFINFNYTDTLTKNFKVPEQNIIHIHGEAADKKSIIVGHSHHPHEPEEFLKTCGRRFEGLYYVEKFLYDTDKHIHENIRFMCQSLAMRGIFAEDIKDIYVLGHSLSNTDMEYFKHIKSATSIHKEPEEEPVGVENLEELFSDEALHNRIQYAIKKYGNDPTITEPILPEEENAVRKMLLAEQAGIDYAMDEEFSKLVLNNLKHSKFDSGNESLPPKQRTKDAKWHISYHSKEDKNRALAMLNTLKCKDYELFDSIDAAIENIKAVKI